MKIIYPSVYNTYTKQKKTTIKKIINILHKNERNIGLIWGGSSLLDNVRTEWSDIDFWLVTEDVTSIKKTIYKELSELDFLTFIYDGGKLQWLGDYYTLFFFKGCTFSIDIGITSSEDIKYMNMGPNPFIIFGEKQIIFSNIVHQRYYIPQNKRFESILVNLIKVNKSLKRNYLWNAIECLSRARSQYLGCIVEYPQDTPIFYTRPERKIEDFLNRDQLSSLSLTCPKYSKSSVAKCTIALLDLCIKLLKTNNSSKVLVREFIFMRENLTMN